MSNELNGGHFLEIQREYVGNGGHEMDDKKNEGQDFSRNNSICHIIPFGNSELLIHYRGTVTRVPAHGFLSMSYDDMTGEVVIEYALNDEVYYACIHVDEETDAETLANTLVRTLSSLNVKSLPPPNQSRFVEKEAKMMSAKSASEFSPRDRKTDVKKESVVSDRDRQKDSTGQAGEFQRDLATHLERRVEDDFLVNEEDGSSHLEENSNLNEIIIGGGNEELMESQEELGEEKRSVVVRNVLLVVSAALAVGAIITVSSALRTKTETGGGIPPAPVPMGGIQQQKGEILSPFTESNKTMTLPSSQGTVQKQNNDEEWQPH